MFLLLIVGVLAALFLGRSVWGRWLLALGRNPEAAHYAGVPVNRMIVVAYVLSSLLAALEGVLFALDVGSVQPAVMGNFYELYAIAAAVLGGCGLRGGEGSILGVVLGAAVMRGSSTTRSSCSGSRASSSSPSSAASCSWEPSPTRPCARSPASAARAERARARSKDTHHQDPAAPPGARPRRRLLHEHPHLLRAGGVRPRHGRRGRRERPRAHHPHERARHGGRDDEPRRHGDRRSRARPGRRDGGRDPRVRRSGPLRLERQPVLRVHGRPRRQPHRRGPLRARRQHLHPRHQQRPEPPARRRSRLRRARLELGADGPRRGDLPPDERRRRGGLSRQPRGLGDLLPDRRERPRLHPDGHDRRGDAGVPHQPRLLEPRRPRRPDRPRPRAPAARRPLHAHRRHAHPHR